ncbi:MAG: PASTA domain-containing protein, partial [Rhodospirillales bacterium]|nr:PASTA domain-containing protein [Rhodospirillales bacterium]
MTGPSRWTQATTWVAFLLVAAVLSACVTVVEQQRPHVQPQPQVSLVPSVEGMALDRARAKLEHAGYRLGDVAKERDRYAPPRSVLWQDPEPYTRAPRGSRVDLVIAARARPDAPPPPDLTSVPELHGLRLKKVRRALRRADLRLGEVTERFTDRAPAGTVIRQRPPATRRVEPGSAIDIVIARAEANQPLAGANVPKLRGLPLEQARAKLRQAQLHLGQVTERADANARRGTVIGQQPAPRTQVRPGTAVDLVIAGRQPNQPVAGANVPKLRGLPLEQARAELRQAQLRLGQVTERADANARRGTVIGQQPAPRTQVRPGTAVDLVIAGRQPNQPVAGANVPKLRGLPLEKARAKLKQAQLRVGQVTESANANAPKGIVIGQQPAPRTQVRPGTAVDLVIAGRQPNQPVAGANVPNLSGLPLKKARAKLKQAQLRLGKVTERADANARRGTVIGQRPAPKRQVKPGTAVDVVVA